MRVGVGFFVDGLVVVEAMVDMVLLAVLAGIERISTENDFIGLEVGVRRFGRGPLGS